MTPPIEARAREHARMATQLPIIINARTVHQAALALHTGDWLAPLQAQDSAVDTANGIWMATNSPENYAAYIAALNIRNATCEASTAHLNRIAKFSEVGLSVTDEELESERNQVVVKSNELDAARAAVNAFIVEGIRVTDLELVGAAASSASDPNNVELNAGIAGIRSAYNARIPTEGDNGTLETAAHEAYYAAHALYLAHMNALVDGMIDAGFDPLNGSVPSFVSTLNLGARVHGMGTTQMQARGGSLRVSGPMVDVPRIRTKESGEYMDIAPSAVAAVVAESAATTALVANLTTPYV